MVTLVQLPGVGPAPTLKSRVTSRGPGLFRMVPFEMPEPEEDSEDDEDEDGGHIKVRSPQPSALKSLRPVFSCTSISLMFCDALHP